MPRDGNCGRASGHQRERCEFYAAWAGDPVWAGSGEERWRKRDRVDCRGTEEAGPEVPVVLRILRRSGPAALEQARAGVADQERGDGWFWTPGAAHAGARFGDRAGPENAARRGVGTARPVRRVCR